MSVELSILEIEEVSSKLKGISFLINGIGYLNNSDEELFTNGVSLVCENIKEVIKMIDNFEAREE